MAIIRFISGVWECIAQRIHKCSFAVEVCELGIRSEAWEHISTSANARAAAAHVVGRKRSVAR